jgi:HK97 gp10 family phage protein
MAGKWEAARRAVKESIPNALTAMGLFGEGAVKVKIRSLNIVDTGNLMNSMSHSVGVDTVRIGTNVEYAVYHEFGTYKMAARPFLRPTIEEEKSEFRSIIKYHLKKGLSGI